MSYDVSIIINTGGETMSVVFEVGNYTSNVGEMYHLAIPDEYPGGGKYDGEGDAEPRSGLPGISGLRCDNAAKILSKAINYMLANRDELIELEPDNGWGSFAGAINYLRTVLSACEKHPIATIAINW